MDVVQLAEYVASRVAREALGLGSGRIRRGSKDRVHALVVRGTAAIVCRAYSAVRAAGGVVLFTVPAFPSLWGLQDEVSHHYRRYRMGPFLKMLDKAKFQVTSKFHFNYI